MTDQPLGDTAMVTRATRSLAGQIAAVVAVAMLLLITIVTAVVIRGQRVDTDRLLRSTAATADDVIDPPADSWIVITRGQATTSSPGLPSALTDALLRLRADPSQHVVLHSVSPQEGGSYRVATVGSSTRVVQVAIDLRQQDHQRDRLLSAMAVAAAASLLVAAAVGLVLGRRAVRPLEHALALQRTFVADASHELRTPLTLLSTRVQVLQSQLTASDRDQQVVADARGVVADVERLGEVVEDLLIAADSRREDRTSTVSVAEVVRGIVESGAAHASARKISLSASILDHPDRCEVRGSAAALRRGILALLDNALDHTPEGGAIVMSVSRQRDDVIVAVADTGSGLDPARAEGVLTRFHSGGQRAGRAHYGLGLALTRDVANRHGGQLRLVPSEVGTTFELVLPATKP